MIEEVKSSLSTSGLEIRGLVDEESGSNLIALVSKDTSDLSFKLFMMDSELVISFYWLNRSTQRVIL